MIRIVIFVILASTAQGAPTQEKNNEIELNSQNVNNDLIIRATPIEDDVILRVYTNNSPNDWFKLTTTNGGKAPINTAYSIQSEHYTQVCRLSWPVLIQFFLVSGLVCRDPLGFLPDVSSTTAIDIIKGDLVPHLSTHLPVSSLEGHFVRYITFDNVYRICRRNVVIHGWNNNGDADWLLEMKNKFLTSGKYNVIIVDWGNLANKLYLNSADETKPVGEYVGKVLASLVQSTQHNLQKVHLIGHSLGAHVAGIAGQQIQKLLGQKVGRATGLDPAAPLFEEPSLVATDERLDAGDATFVDVIHTAGGGLVAVGFRHSLGHVDFYPNGGSGQNGCVTLQLCDHQRSHIYFTESITSKGFISTECSSWNDFKNSKCTGNRQEIMGLFVSTSARGDYYLATNSKTPFALGHAL